MIMYAIIEMILINIYEMNKTYSYLQKFSFFDYTEFGINKKTCLHKIFMHYT